MHRFRLTLACITIAVSSIANAAYIPSVQQSTGYDEIKTSTGIVCRQSMSNQTYINMGVTGSQNNYRDEGWDNWNSRDNGEAMVYVQMTIPIGSPERMDCSRIYDLEVERQQLEIQQLKTQLELLQKQSKLATMNLPPLN